MKYRLTGPKKSFQKYGELNTPDIDNKYYWALEKYEIYFGNRRLDTGVQHFDEKCCRVLRWQTG